MAAVDEIWRGLSRNGIPKLSVEAVVDRENMVSLQVAEKMIGCPRTECLDRYSGVPAIQFKCLVDSGVSAAI